MDENQNDQKTDVVGAEKDESAGAEAGGRGKKVLYICYNCGTGNYVDPGTTTFICWKCGTGGASPLP